MASSGHSTSSGSITSNPFPFGSSVSKYSSSGAMVGRSSGLLIRLSFAITYMYAVATRATNRTASVEESATIIFFLLDIGFPFSLAFFPSLNSSLIATSTFQTNIKNLYLCFISVSPYKYSLQKPYYAIL